MPKKTPVRSSVFEHFTVTTDNKHFECQCVIEDDFEKKNCESRISAYCGTDKNRPTRASNLKRHLERFHPEISNKVTEKDKAAAITQQASAATASTSSVCGARGKEPKLTKFLSPDKITATMTAEKFRKCIIDLVVHNGVALSLFSQPAFLELAGEMARRFGISLERQSIRKLVINEAADKKKRIDKNTSGSVHAFENGCSNSTQS